MDEKAPTQEPSLSTPEVSSEVLTYESEPPTNTGAMMPRPTRLPTAGLLQKKWLTIGIAAVILFVIVGLTLVYNLWYQNPQKVITDGLAQAITATSVRYTATFSAVGSSTAKIAVDGNATGGQQGGLVTLSLTSAGKSYAIKGAVVLDKANNVYFKLTNVSDLVKPYRAALPKSGQTLLDELTAKLGNNWIKLSPTDLKNYNSGLAAAQECTTAALASLQNDKSAASELGTIYKKHQFITISKKLGSKNGSLGYQITTNQTVTKAFMKDFQTTVVYRALHACNPNLTTRSMADLFAGTSGQTTIYVSRFTHHITSLTIASNDSKTKTSATFMIAPTFNVPVTIQVPTKTTTVAQLLGDLQAVLQSAAKP